MFKFVSPSAQLRLHILLHAADRNTGDKNEFAATGVNQTLLPISSNVVVVSFFVVVVQANDELVTFIPEDFTTEDELATCDVDDGEDVTLAEEFATFGSEDIEDIAAADDPTTCDVDDGEDVTVADEFATFGSEDIEDTAVAEEPTT
jgi:hypothetical protein